MTDATYALKVDLNRDFDFSDTDEDLSNRLLAAHWFNGFQGVNDFICRDSIADFLLDNMDGRLSPELTGAIAGLDQGKTVTFDMNFGGPQRMFTGWVDRPAIDPDPFGEKTATLYCNSWVTRAGKTKNFLVPTQRNKRVDQIIPELIDRTGVFPPGLSGLIWLLDVPGLSELDVTTYLSDATSYLTAETGGVTVARIGHKWTAQTSLFQAMKEVIGREGQGRFFLGRDGKLVFWNRDHLFLDTSLDQTFDDTHPFFKPLEYEYASLLFNSVQVKYSNAKTGSAPEILGVSNNEIVLAPGETKSTNYRFADQTTGVAVGGQDSLAPVLGTDYTAWTATGGTGASVTSGITAAISKDGGTGVEVRFTNTNATTVYIKTGSQVRGTKVVDVGDQSMPALDGPSIAARGEIAWTHPATVEGADYANSLANFYIGQGITPRGYFRSFSIDARASDDYMNDAKNLGVGSLVSLTGAKTNTAAGQYFIISEEHWVTADPYRHTVKYRVEPASGQRVWLLDVTGYSELDLTTTLAPW